MILDSFLLNFRSDSSQAQKDVDALNKKIADLTATGKKRTDQENIELKQLKEKQKSLKETANQTKETANQYTKLAESAGQAAAALIGVGSIVAKGVLKNSSFNSDLQVQSKLLGQSAKDLQAYDNLFASLGGRRGAFKEFIQSHFKDYADKTGQNLLPADQIVAKIKAQLKASGTEGGREFQFSRLEIDDAGLRSGLGLSDKALKEKADYQKSLTSNLTDQNLQDARDLTESTSKLEDVFSAMATTVAADLNPPLKKTFDLIAESLVPIKDDSSAIGGLALAFGGLGAVIASSVLIPLGGVATLIGGIAVSLGAIAAVGGVGLLAYDAVKNKDKSVLGRADSFMQKKVREFYHTDSAFKPKSDESKNDRTTSKPLLSREDDIKFLESQGFLASEADELIDSPELESGKNSKSPKAAAKVAPKYNGESLKRGKQALDIANNTPLASIGGDVSNNNSKNVTINMGDINVTSPSSNPQDLAQHINDAFSRHVKLGFANTDDGIGG